MYAYHLRLPVIRGYPLWTGRYCSHWLHMLIVQAALSLHWRKSPQVPGSTNLPSRAPCFVSNALDTSFVEKEKMTGRANSRLRFTRSSVYLWMNEKLDSILWLVHECINLWCRGELTLEHGCAKNKNHYSDPRNQRARFQRGAPLARYSSEGF